jgi:hypothetical protein
MITAVYAADSTPKPLAKARELLLQKDRVAAAQVLQTAIGESKRDGERNELIRELQNIGNLFLTEEGQKSFELAESLLYSAAGGVEGRYEEALTKEPGNVQVLLGLARAKLAKNDCSGASETLADADKINPYSIEKKYLRARTNHCLKLPAQKKSEATSATGELKRYWLFLQAQSLVDEQKLKEAQALLFKDAKELQDWNMPEINFLRFKVFASAAPEAIEFAQKYIDQCKTISASLRRQYKFEPRLCVNASDAEDFVKKNEVPK